MKKIALILTLVMGIAISIEAQPRAVGARLGGNMEASYQHQLGAKNMIDATAGLTLGWNWMAVSATAVYDWIFPINSWNNAGKWNWYAGPGAGVGFVIPASGYSVRIPVALNIGGQAGIEYQFEFPLTLSLDYRPMINVLGFGSYWTDYSAIALGVRYRF